MFKAVVGQTDKAGFVAPHHRLQHVQGSSVYHTLFNSKLCFQEEQSIHIWLPALNSMISLCSLVQFVLKYEDWSVGWNFLIQKNDIFLNTFSNQCV